MDYAASANSVGANSRPRIDVAAGPAQADTLQLACSEIAGGNRPVNAAIELPGMRGKVFSRPCDGGRGGDVHYLTVCDSGLVCQILIADVVGHGEAVAEVSAQVYSLLRRYLNRLDQRRILRKLNRRLEKVGFDALTTAVAVNYFPPWRRLSVSYAGHPNAWLYRKASRQWSPIDTDDGTSKRDRYVNLPLAFDSQTAFTRATVKVDIGDRLLVLTDGVLEAPDETGVMLGTERLKSLLEETGGGGPAESVDAIVDGLLARATGGEFSHDDVTLLLVEFVPGPRGPATWHAIKNRVLGLRRIGKRSPSQSNPAHAP